MASFFIESKGLANELFLTQFTISPRTTGMETKFAAEQTLRQRYKDFILRFHYGTLEHGEKPVSSAQFGALTVEPNLRSKAMGGAVFGTPIRKISAIANLCKKEIYAYCNNHKAAVHLCYIENDIGGYLFHINNYEVRRLGYRTHELRLTDTEVLSFVYLLK